MAKSDDILKKYGITQVTGSEDGTSSTAKTTSSNATSKSVSTGSTKADNILAKYGIGQVINGVSTTPIQKSTIAGYNGKDATTGWSKYLVDRMKKKKEEAEKSRFERVAAGFSLNSGTTLPGANISTVINEYRKDTSYREPTDKWSAFQKNEFGYLYNQSPAKAWEYAEKVNTSIAEEEDKKQETAIKKSATASGWKGAAHTAGALLTAPLGLADYLDNVAEYIARGRITEKPGLTPFEYSQTVTSSIADKLNGVDMFGVAHNVLPENIPIIGGKGWGDVYGLGTSIAQSAIAGYTGGKIGTLIQFFGSAAAAGIDEAKQRGATDDQALLVGTLSGAAEGLAEMIGVDNLLKIGSASTMRGLLTNLVKQGAAEGLEEGLTSLMNNFADQIVMKDKSNFNLMVQELVRQGMPIEEAKKKAWWSMAEDLAYDMVAGFASGAIHAGPQTAIQTINENVYQPYQTGKAILEADGSVDALKQLASEVAGASSEEMQQKLTKRTDRVVENPSALRVGKLYDTVQTASNLANAPANQADIAKSLERKGFDSQKANAVAEALVAKHNGQELTKAQEKTLASVKDNAAVQAAISNIVTNTKSTMGQRSQNLRKFQRDVTIGRIAKASGISADEVRNIAEGNLTTAEENGSESHYEVSADGKTIDKDGNIVTIKGIASIKDGHLVLDAETGTVDAGDLSFASQSEALVYEAVANLGDIIDIDTANRLSKHLLKLGDVNSDVYANGIVQAYTYGYYGYGRDRMTGENTLSATLTEKQRNVAYGLGEQYRAARTAAEEALLRETRTNEKSSAVGKVHFDGDRSTLTERQSASLDAMETVAEALGVQIYVFESKMGENGKRIGANGWYNPKDNSIHIDLHAGATGEGTMLFTLAHELTHHIRKWSPAKFKILADFLMQEYGQKGVSVDALVREQIAKAKRGGRTISYDTAYEEVIADSMEAMLSDGSVMEKLAKLKQVDKSLWQKIKDFISELAAKIRKVYEGMTPDSVEGRYVAEMVDAIENLQEMFTEALVEASENYQASLTPGVEGIIVNQNGDPVAHATSDGTIQLSMRTYEEEGREAFRKYLQKCVSSKKLTKAEMQEMLGGIEEVYGICKEFKDKYAPFSSWSDAAVVRDTHGKPVFSVVTPNGDYKMNLDFSLVCKKRRTLDAVFNEMSRRGIIDDFELGQKSVVKINEIIRKYDLETACALCFVDAKRFRQASMADQFTRLYNELVESLVPEDQRGSIDHFNFSGYSTIKKVEGGIDTWANSKLDFSHINHVLKTYGDGTVEWKAANYIKTHAEGRKLLLRGDFMSSQGFDAVKTQNPDVLKLYNSKKGTGGPKAAFGDVQYLNEIIQKARWWTPAKAYEVGGVRIQSFSDYVPRMVFDYVQMIYDLAATKLPAHAYTKEALFVKQFGLTGVKINMSLIPAIAEGGIAPGLDANGNYVWAGESFDFETAKEIQNAEGYTENCGTICVGVSYQHIVKLLGDPNIRMVIPYHKSGLNPIVAHMNKIAEFTDYTTLKTNPGGCQNTIDKNGSKVETDFNFNDVLRKTGDPKATVRKYLDWCAKNEYTPRFAEFAWHENYYKLIEDFTLYDKDGKYVPQREVRAVFPKETDAFGSMKDLIQEGLEEDAIVEGKRDKNLSKIVDEIQKTLPKTEAEISEEQVAQADRDLEAVELSDSNGPEMGVLYSNRDVTSWDINWDEDNHSTIKSQMVKHMAEINRMNPVADIEFDKRKGKTYAEILDEVLRTKFGYKIDRADGASFLFDKVAIATLRRYVGSDEEAAAVTAAPYVLKRGKAISGHKNHKNLGNPSVTYAGPVTINGERVNVGVVVLFGDKNRPHSLRVLMPSGKEYVLKKTETDPKRKGASPDGGVRSSTGSASTKTVTQPEQKVKKYSDRDTESISNRSLLANAFEGVAQNDSEKRKIKEYKSKIDLINAEERKLAELNQQIKDLSFSKGPKDTKAIRDLQFEAQQTANRISTYDKQLLRLEASQPLQDVLTREKNLAYKRAEKKGKDALEKHREKSAKTQRELIDRYQTARKRGIESREKTAMRHKIKDVVNELNQYLLSGNKDKRVMMPLKKAVAEALDAVNMDTVGAEARVAKLQEELLKAKTPEAIQEISRKIDHVQQMGDRMSSRLKALKDAYREIAESDDPLIANSHDDVIEAKLESVIENVGNTPLRDMNISQLEEVYDMYRMVLTTIRNSNKAFKAAKNESIAILGNRVMEEIDQTGGKKKYNIAALEAIKKFGWNNLKPVYAFEHIGSKTFTEVFNNVRSGEDVWAVDVTEAREFYLDKARKYKYDSWNFDKRYTFTSSSGMNFTLNLEQIMSLYAYSKRDQAADHLKRGGIVIDESTEITMKTKLGFKAKFNPTEATAYNISEETLADITGKLTDAQKQYVDEMQEYLSTVMGEKGNEVSLELYGIKLFKEKFYFPLKSASQFMAKAKEQQQGEVKIKNSGFSKETVKKASNPIVLTPFMNVWANHVNEMSMYHAFVLPMEDFYRVYNYRTPTSDTMATESVEMYLQNAYGKGATKYIDQLLKDLNGGARTDSTTGVINKMMGLFKKGAVFASLSVVVQQPSAIARAAALVDTKYFIGPKVDHKRHKALWEEVKQYAPVAIIKEMGYFDTNMGKSTQDFILGKEYSGFKDKMKALFTDSNFRDEALSKAPALADEISWCSIWEAVKRETKAKHPGMSTKSEAFLKAAGERFTEVIVKTQVYDSVLSRSANMRSKDTGMKMATAFMAEPTTSINMIADALLQGKRGKGKYARATIGAVIASQILNSILVSFVYAGRDDDEDETYLEKYIGTFTGEVLDSLNPAGYIPFIKDIMSIVQGYDVERSDMAVISDLWNAYQKLGSDKLSTYRKVEGFAGSIAQIFGLPLKNIMRDVRGIYQTIDSFVNGQKTTKAGIGYAVKGAITGETVANDQQLYDAYLSGDQTQIARVKGRFKDASAVSSAIRKALRANDPRIREAAIAWNANDLDEYMRIAKSIIGEKHFSQDDVVMAIRAEANSLAPEKETTTTTAKAKGLFTTEKFAEAIAQGDQATANAIKSDIIQTAQRNGKTAAEAEKSFSSSASGDCKDLFVEGRLSEDRAIKALVDYCGLEQEEAEKKVGEWVFQKEYGFYYSDRGDAYKSGAISRQELKNILMDVGGKTAEDAEWQIKVYDWQSEGYDIDLNQKSVVEDFETFCQPAGIDKGTYFHAYLFYKDSGQSDVAYSKTIECMPYINSLPLTPYQKTALAKCWWAESTVRKYKLW